MQLYEFIFCILCLLEKCSILLGLFMRYANFFLDLIFDGCCQKKMHLPLFLSVRLNYSCFLFKF